MKKLSLLKGRALLFASCSGSANADNDNTSNEKKDEVVTIEKSKFSKFADLNITADNAGEYVLKISYTLTDPEKKGYGAGAICDSGWTDAKVDPLEVKEDNTPFEIEVSKIIEKLPEGFLINWWANYATLDKIELIKKA